MVVRSASVWAGWEFMGQVPQGCVKLLCRRDFRAGRVQAGGRIIPAPGGSGQKVKTGHFAAIVAPRGAPKRPHPATRAGAYPPYTSGRSTAANYGTPGRTRMHSQA